MKRREFLFGSGSFAALGFIGDEMSIAGSGFRAPPEEAPHQRTFMQWPVHRQIYKDRMFLDVTQQTIANIANAIAEFEPVTMLAAADDHTAARKKLSDNVELWDIPTDDLWCRDAGPIFVIGDGGKMAVAHIHFNGWGEKQVNRHDSQIAARVAERLGLELIPSGLRGEGGGVEHDGHGLLMAHESSWVNDNRNPGLTKNDIERRLLAAYGAKRMIWSDGLSGKDITDYHIDSLARLTGPGRVLINLPDTPDEKDPFHKAALKTHRRLVAEGLDIDVIPEPHTPRVKSFDFVASYSNYYACNGAVIAAQFGDKETDQIARDALARHYPGRDIVLLNVDALGELGGGIHCATQQMPAG